MSAAPLAFDEAVEPFRSRLPTGSGVVRYQ
jgi:hypothetical protein